MRCAHGTDSELPPLPRQEHLRLKAERVQRDSRAEPKLPDKRSLQHSAVHRRVAPYRLLPMFERAAVGKTISQDRDHVSGRGTRAT